jgi:Tol biopolymer transport system component
MKIHVSSSHLIQNNQMPFGTSLNPLRFFLAMVMLLATLASWQWGTTLPAAQAAYSGNNGKIALTSDRDGAGYDIHLINANGSGRINITNSPAVFDQTPDWSPDGTKIALTADRDGNFEVYIMNSNGTVPIRLTNNGAFESSPRYSPGGTKIAFETTRDGNSEIYVMNSDGSDSPTNLTSNSATDTTAGWSPDGTQIAFTSNRDENQEIYVTLDDGSGVPVNITNNSAGDAGPAWSPDGTQIAFASTRLHANGDVFVMSADGTGQTPLTNQPSLDGRPDWSPDGLQIIFDSNRDDNNGDNFIMNSDGTGQINLTSGSPSFEFSPDWQSIPTIPVPQFQFKFGSIGSANGQFINPHDVATDASGNIYVTDGNNHRIQVFDSSGTFLYKFGSFGSGDGMLNTPHAIDLDPDGNLLVADLVNDGIQKFDAAGNFLLKFGTFCNIGTLAGCIDPDGPGPLEVGDGQFWQPGGIAVDGSGNIVVAGTPNNRIQVFGVPTPESISLTAVKDSFLRSGTKNTNEGANSRLRISSSGNNRTVVGFDVSGFDANNVTSARLILTIAENADNWGQNGDRTVDAHSLLESFAEGNGMIAEVTPQSAKTRGTGSGVTWNCAIDDEISDHSADCVQLWNGGTFGPATAPSVLHVNGLTGQVEWDVTIDAQAGTSEWLIKKTLEDAGGKVIYYSREGALEAGNPDLAPTLIVDF